MKTKLTRFFFCGVLLAWTASATAEVFTNRASGERLQGRLVTKTKKDGVVAYFVKLKSGTMRTLPFTEWAMSTEADEKIRRLKARLRELEGEVAVLRRENKKLKTAFRDKGQAPPVIADIRSLKALMDTASADVHGPADEEWPRLKAILLAEWIRARAKGKTIAIHADVVRRSESEQTIVLEMWKPTFAYKNFPRCRASLSCRFDRTDYGAKLKPLKKGDKVAVVGTIEKTAVSSHLLRGTTTILLTITLGECRLP